GVVAGRRVVVAGTGPFLLPVAAGLAAAGAGVAGVYEAHGGLGLARHPLLALGTAGEAAGYLATLARNRVPYRTRHAVVGAHGGRGGTRAPRIALGRAGGAPADLAPPARTRVPDRTRHAVVAAHGDREREAVTVARRDRDWNVLATRRVPCDALATGYGFVP